MRALPFTRYGLPASVTYSKIRGCFKRMSGTPPAAHAWCEHHWSESSKLLGKYAHATVQAYHNALCSRR
eukprot:349984-Chlamydomonas_euryale.AAC.6